jgi:FkbM family methyltransferase
MANTRRLSARAQRTRSILSGGALTLLDVGAANGAPSRWDPYASLTNYIAVEPDPRSIETLASTKKNGYRSSSTITSGLWSETRDIDLNLCRKPEVSSVYAPNTAFLRRFPEAGRFDVVGRTSMKVTTLDAVATELDMTIDALKIDVQGAELDVLLGAEKTLESVLLIEAEVEFVSLYENQSLFGSVSHMLSQQGFEFLDFLALYRWHPRHLDGTGQLVFADALFMRTPESLKAETTSTLRKYAALAMIYQRGEVLSRLAKVVDDPSLVRELEMLERFVSDHISQSRQILNFAARAARIRDNALHAHMIH